MSKQLSYKDGLVLIAKMVTEKIPADLTQEQRDIYITGYAQAIWDLAITEPVKEVTPNEL